MVFNAAYKLQIDREDVLMIFIEQKAREYRRQNNPRSVLYSTYGLAPFSYTTTTLSYILYAN